ncbi:DEKNAAC102206 [Brettanomyces naardenensis]|uniref:Dolichyl-phosphate-mannose--protein mannosyltransferase n=1 Tax=Brettanomyces naardenensis TaxID=13370 RepID=A0A448YLA9_BRENA|nr:DEKNAAC102206 [Brettanomyces naardenensis]
MGSSRLRSSRRADADHKQRGGKASDEKISSNEDVPSYKRLSSIDPSMQKWYTIACTSITAVAFAARFYYIWYPSEVVFDEVHFGKFASYYLQRTYFFDLHPPFAKLLIALVGYLAGYDGSFKFDNIGDSYLEHSVPYIPFRALSATLGTLTVPLVFNTLKECGYSVYSCVFASALVALDNAHVAETRLILLDATLLISVAASIYSYVRFYKLRRQPFTRNWYLWLFLTGVALSCVISTKYVGVFTFAAIGVAVIYDLWQLLDIKKGHSMTTFFKHFAVRLLLLIVVPFFIYLFWFYLHFAILTKSGPGDGFMSPEFQETLGDSLLARQAKDIYYHDVITIKHKDTECLLHSHNFRYPLRYEDGRVSSQGQQVTCMSDYNDTNNYWEILPASQIDQSNHVVREGDTFRLRHVNTNGYLLTHDVASPLFSTNEEFTVIPLADLEKGTNVNDTLFKFDPFDKKKHETLKTKASIVKILHVPTVVAMWTHDDNLLPDWGFGQQEVNGNKKLTDNSNYWFIDDIIGLSGARALYVPKNVKKIPFLKKWWEAQLTMFDQNNKLTSEHPFASQPEEWPMCLSGVSFWTKSEAKQQIFFLGNIPGWWMECIFISGFLAIILVDQLTRRRNVNILTDRSRTRLYLNIGFFFSAWASHYLPFFLMGRQKFLHHYLPAHLLAALLSGSMLEFLFTDNRTEEYARDRKDEKDAGRIQWTAFAAAVVGLLSVIVWGFIFFAPVTYGNVSLTPEQVQNRQWMNMQLHFAK